MRQKNWEEFYKKGEAPEGVSDFAKFIANKIDFEDVMTTVDVGCGSGRDTYFLGTFSDVKGIDPNTIASDNDLAEFVKLGFKDAKNIIENADMVYSRFLLHSISDVEIIDLVEMTPDYFVAEARAQGDEPSIYTDHDRNFLNGGWLLTVLIRSGFDIEYYEKGHGLAVYRDEDPLIIRIIAKRK